MKQRLKDGLHRQGGFVLVFAMLMILLLMIFMTAMVTTVGYTNAATKEKSQEHQLQLTAQSAVGTLKEMFSQEENKTKIAALAASGAVQDYDLTGAGITNRVKARVTDSGQPGYALLTVTAYDENGNEYTTTTLLPMMAAQGNKNDLIENMIVSYYPNTGAGLTQELTYDNNVMNGSIIIDNQRCAGAYEGNGDKYKTDPLNDNTAVRVKGGTFKELVTTGNLILNAEQPIKGTGNTTIASAVGQLVVTKGEIGEGIKEIGAGGYFISDAKDENGNRTNTSKEGKIQFGTMGDVKLKGNMDIISRDKVNVELNRVFGTLNNCFVGGTLKYTAPDNGQAKLDVAGDLQVYKSATYDVKANGAELNVQGDVATGDTVTINFGSNNTKLTTPNAIVTAIGDIKVTGNGTVNAAYLLSGKGINAASGKAVLTGGSKGYSLFSGGNYGVNNTYYQTNGDDRGKTVISKVTSGVPAVINNKKGDIGANTVLTKSDSAEGLNAFRTMNSLWLTKAQKVYKGGWWNSCKDVKFATALLFDGSVPSTYISKAGDSTFKRSYDYITEPGLRYNPKGSNTDVDRLKNWQWYEMKNETYFGGNKVPVSHELGYTTNDSAFLLRSTLQVALGGPTDSTNLNINATAQGKFVDTARTAIPYDGAINEIQVNYPHFANFEGSPAVNEIAAGYASITDYKDGYLIGASGSTTGYMNFGRVEFRNDGQALYDGTNTYSLSGKTLYFKSTSPILPGGWGDFYFTSDNGEIKLNNKLVIEYSLNGTEAEDLSKLGFVRIFLDPNVKLNFGHGVSVEGVNNGSVNVADVDFNYNNFHYTEIMPELYFFCSKPSQEAKINFEMHTSGIDAFIVAPWSVVNMRDIGVSKDTEVFKGVLLCKNFIRADGGTYNHYKPISFGYAMSDAVFVLPETK